MRWIYTLAVLAFLGSAFAPTASAGHATESPLTFALTAEPGALPGTFKMVRGGHTVTTGPVAYANTNAIACHIWISDEPAAVSLSFPLQNVDWRLEFGFPSDIAAVTVNLGTMAGVFVPNAGSFDNLPDVEGLDRVAFQNFIALGGLNVIGGDFLALRVCVDTLVLNAATLQATGFGDSQIAFAVSPPPPWPTPELGTIALTATGLLGLAGVGLVRRRKL